MRRLRVGDQLYEGVAGFEEGTHYNYTLAGHTLIISIKNPLPEHITAVSGGEAVFGLATRDRTAFVLCRFGNLHGELPTTTGGSTHQFSGRIRGATWKRWTVACMSPSHWWTLRMAL